MFDVEPAAGAMNLFGRADNSALALSEPRVLRRRAV